MPIMLSFLECSSEGVLQEGDDLVVRELGGHRMLVSAGTEGHVDG